MVRMESDKTLTVAEAAEALGVPPQTVRAWIRRGVLPATADGKVRQSEAYAANEIRLGDRSRRLTLAGLEERVDRAASLAEETARTLRTVCAALGIGEYAIPSDRVSLLDLHEQAEALVEAPEALSEAAIARWSRVFYGLLPAHLETLERAGVDEPWRVFLDLAGVCETIPPTSAADVDGIILRASLASATRALRAMVYLRLAAVYDRRIAKGVVGTTPGNLPDDPHARVRFLATQPLG